MFLFLVLVIFISVLIYNRGYDKEGYDKEGYDKEGYDKSGYDKEGYDLLGRKEGYDLFGYDKEGYDKEGYDRSRFNRDKISKETGTLYNKSGYDKEGYDRSGFNRDKISKETGTLYNKSGYDKFGFNKDKISKETGTLYNKSGYDKEGYDKEGYDLLGRKEGYDLFGYDKEGYDKEGYDISGFNRDKISKETGTLYNKSGYDKEGYDKEGYDLFGRKGGYDLFGYDKEGYDISGYDRFSYDKPQNFIPDNSIKLKKPSKNGENYSYLWDYYPTRFKVSFKDEEIRKKIWLFKDGKTNKTFANLLSSALCKLYKKEELKNMVIVPIPASKKHINTLRYKNLLNCISQNIGIENGYSYIEVTEDREAKHLSGKSNDNKNYRILEDRIKNKKIILLDDIITSGKGYNKLSRELLEKGSKSVCGLFLGRTANQNDYDLKYPS